ncbi:hypothetical protein H696_00279 [Fonticula alba]|uniref:Uncharacterized protein n=1 Tax=Fonticula alba TaxID=691883 RepID=A0A058ZE71_FONAL|nr:hypothetical protein H696_00279 [Fonticula alba]KCV72700.1 hypothetical protein H696_00279 [Fonticula alba]|eukprot:XP_009492401.1 hypothetical protein H696_00279 [Fonticula alba]
MSSFESDDAALAALEAFLSAGPPEAALASAPVLAAAPELRASSGEESADSESDREDSSTSGHADLEKSAAPPPSHVPGTDESLDGSRRLHAGYQSRLESLQRRIGAVKRARPADVTTRPAKRVATAGAVPIVSADYPSSEDEEPQDAEAIPWDGGIRPAEPAPSTASQLAGDAVTNGDRSASDGSSSSSSEEGDDEDDFFSWRRRA